MLPNLYPLSIHSPIWEARSPNGRGFMRYERGAQLEIEGFQIKKKTVAR